ncbi:MAG: hypothetical protein O2894_02335 [Planctomycetota bacterium]|nr:hypothetical protein [Planctomycetota bacterium]
MTRAVAAPRSMRGLTAVVILAGALALATIGFALRAPFYVPPGPPPGGLFGASGQASAEATVARLARGLLGQQQADGGFDLDVAAYETDRVASSALAIAALARTRERGLQVAGLDAGLALGLDFLKKRQIDTGAIGYEEPLDRWSQVDGTSAAVLAFGVARRPEDEEALKAAASALRRFARARLRNGWTRGLGVMATDALIRRGQGEVFGADPLILIDIRDLKQAPREGPPQTSDWNVAEVISRVVRGLRKGTDPFPAALVAAVLAEPAEWTSQSTDCGAWWMQAWLVARSGAPGAADWFASMQRVLAEEAILETGTIKGGWYANTVTQTAGALLAMLEGLSSEVVSGK